LLGRKAAHPKLFLGAMVGSRVPHGTSPSASWQYRDTGQSWWFKSPAPRGCL